MKLNPKNTTNVLMFAMHIYMAEVFYIEITSDPSNTLFRQQMKKLINTAYSSVNKILNMLNSKFDNSAVDWQNDTSNKLFGLNTAFMMCSEQDREKLLEMAREMANEKVN